MSDTQYLYIHKFPALFSILNEIKSKLNFNIKNINDDKFDENLYTANIVIISGDNKFSSIRQIKLESLPLNIQKLTEIINIQFLKNRFNKQNRIKVGKYHLNLNSRTIMSEKKSLSMTEKETKIITFLNNSKKAITINDLQKEVWGHKSKLETHTVETHVYRLRKKIEKKFDDKSFIISLKNGYKIKS